MTTEPQGYQQPEPKFNPGDIVCYDTKAYADYMLYVAVNPGVATIVDIGKSHFTAKFGDSHYSNIPKSICWK